jgi:hypothetical protein
MAAADAVLKAEMLAHGVRLSAVFLSRYGLPYLEKRRAYGNSDNVEMLTRRVPQEMYLGDSRLVAAVNLRGDSPWELDWDERFVLRRQGDAEVVPVDFPRRPAFYDARLTDGAPVSRVVTLYGGGSLGVFIYGDCALVEMGKACQYCSIQPNHASGVDFEAVIHSERLEAALDLALADAAAPITQVMLNGGNFKEPDRSFQYYAQMARAARRAIERAGRNVELHLIVFPPRDLTLLGELAELGLSLAMNMEVFTPELFERYCPGKTDVTGQTHIEAALVRAAEILGEGTVYSIVVGGLEPVAAFHAGASRLAERGVTPVINVFHPDPGTPLSDHPAPSVAAILELGAALQDVYSKHKYVRPFYQNCGRNSIDTEAHLQLFA